MISRIAVNEANRRAIRTSTDPEWQRRQLGQHQHSAIQCIGWLICGLAFMAAIVAIGSI